MNFNGKWRNYQKRILDNLQKHLDDDKLHVVAAPGAGKTTLGIEVISRLNRPSLILCPTNTIKNQWRERICSAFLEKENYDKVSTNIKNPSFVTVTTYQALLAAFCQGKNSDNDEEIQDKILEEDNDYSTSQEDDDLGQSSITTSKRFNSQKADEIIKILKDAKISLLCFDEAHHLRKEWWKALTYLVEKLEPKQTLALTATPPYDVDYTQWQRYEELCGPIDEVISIPELVQNKDLCPHQDFIYFSPLKINEIESIKKYDNAVKEIVTKLTNDNILIHKLSNLKFLIPEDDDDVEFIFENPQFVVSIVSLLNFKGINPSNSFLNLFNAKKSDLPKFDIEQAKIFLNNFIFCQMQNFEHLGEKIQEYHTLAYRSGLIYNKKLVFDGNIKIQKQIANSIGKLDSIKDIVDLELKSMGNNLRMVILADLIKANDTGNTHLGVVPIWRTLKDKYFDSAKLGILCGSLIVIPKDTQKNFDILIGENDLSQEQFSLSNYKEDERFILITPKESAKHKIVHIITELFNRGHLTILIGTQALLGEGWDAPVINSLILSSTVSSYMLSNQMRGRAIRIDKNNPNKISNIWHLASVYIPQKSDYAKNLIFENSFVTEDIENDSKMYDLAQLSKRFDGFEAPSYYQNHEIISGINRVLSYNFTQKIFEKKEKFFFEQNAITMGFAKDREQTKKWWESGLYLGYNTGSRSIKTGVETPVLSTKTLVYKGYKQIFISILICFLGVLYAIWQYAFAYPRVLILWAIALIICLGYTFMKYLKTGSASSIMKQIAIVHLETLFHLDLIKTSLHDVGIFVNDNEDYLFVCCENLSTEENNLLIKSIQEFLDPIENPRYVLVKTNYLKNFIRQTDYFSIPSIISTNKKNVEMFENLWKKHIGHCEIVYTRNFEGRKLLLKARTQAFSSTKRDKTKRLSKWQ